jgi:hypothetical protein
MSNRVTEQDLEEAAKSFRQSRIDAGEKTWLSVEYYNGHCHLHRVDADTEARHCCLSHVTGGTKRECLQYIHAAAF